MKILQIALTIWFYSIACKAMNYDIPKFINKEGAQFTLKSLDSVSKEYFIIACVELFKDPKVYVLYERGIQKNENDCGNMYKRAFERFSEVKEGNQLGWSLIIDHEEQMKGFVGGCIHKPNNIKIAVALSSELHKTGVITNALMEYFIHSYPKLKEEVINQITHIKAPINPLNKASLALARHFDNSIEIEKLEQKTYIPEYYKNLSEEKGRRVDVIIDIKMVKEKVKEYQKNK